MHVLLDSSACIAIMRNRPTGARDLLTRWAPGDAGICAIVFAELELGVSLSQHAEASRLAVSELLANVAVLPFDSDSAVRYGRLRARLQTAGSMIGSLDCLIAAHALSLGLPLMTGNISEFGRVPGLEVLPIAT